MGGKFDYAAYLMAVKNSKPFLNLLALGDLREHAQHVVERAKALAPVGTVEEGDPTPGAMRDDIGIKGEGIDAKGPYVDVGTTEPYGLFQEFGTEHNPPQPFMRPALAGASGEMKGSISLAPRRKKG